jgi:hypothetical protein
MNTQRCIPGHPGASEGTLCIHLAFLSATRLAIRTLGNENQKVRSAFDGRKAGRKDRVPFSAPFGVLVLVATALEAHGYDKTLDFRPGGEARG